MKLSDIKAQLLAKARLLAKCALLSGLFTNSAAGALAAPGAQLADDTLIVVTKPNTDTTSLKTDIVGIAHATSIIELRANRDRWSILHVTPRTGQREATLKQIASMR